MIASALPSVRPFFKNARNPDSNGNRSFPLENRRSGIITLDQNRYIDDEAALGYLNQEQHNSILRRIATVSIQDTSTTEDGSQTKLWDRDEGSILRTVEIDITREVRDDELTGGEQLPDSGLWD